MSIAIRPTAAADVPIVAALVETAFSSAMARHFSAQGRATFRQFAASTAIAARLSKGAEGWVAAIPDGTIVGYAELDGDHLRMLFVPPGHQRRGIGRKLMNFVLERRSGRTVSVNSAPIADAFYRALGFKPTGQRRIENGIVFTPMSHPSGPAPPARPQRGSSRRR